MVTLAELADRAGADVLDHRIRNADIPMLAGPQCQGDLFIVPLDLLDADQIRVAADGRWVDVPAAGVELLRGTAAGNPHTLVADRAACQWTTDIADETGLGIGVLRATGAVYLLHREHGAIGLAPGTYLVRRQREQGIKQRFVMD
jgi:hypothetical protein